MHRRARNISLLITIVTLAHSSQVFAVESIEEILVTAQKREQLLQDVPISVLVVGRDKILEQGYSRLVDLAAFAPNFTVNESATGNQINIRGFGTSTINAVAFEQAVATFVDGVYFGRETQSFNSLLDIERVEVLRGPQTTFFGQSAIAGALNIQTRKANMEEFEGFIKVGQGEDGDRRFQGAVGGPITDSLGVRIAGSWRDFDGWSTNASTGADSLGQESWAGRISFLWQPTDKLDVNVKFEEGELDVTPGGAHIVSCSAVPVSSCRIQDSILPGADPFDAADDGISSVGGTISVGGRVVVFLGQVHSGVDLTPLWGTNLNYSDWGKLDGIRRIEQDSQALEINYQVGSYLLSYTGASSSAQNSAHGAGDLDFTGLFLHQQAGGPEYSTDSHELRLTSPGGETVDWMAGVYLQEGTTENEFVNLQAWRGGPPGPPPATTGFGSNRAYEEDQTYLSGFAAVTWNVSDNFALDTAIRYIDVEKDGESCVHGLSIDPAQIGNPITVTVPGCTVIGSNWNVGTYNDTNWDYSAAIRYAMNDTVNLYAKFTDGFKAGGFNSLWVGDPALFSFEPEEVEAYEVGLKGMYLDGRLGMNLALFHMSYTNLQVTGRIDTPFGSLFPILNAAEATSQGLELDAQWAVNDNLTLGAAVALLDAAYDSFPGATCGNIEGIAGYKGCVFFGPGQKTLDRAGETLVFSPEWSTSLFIAYRTAITGSLELRLNADISIAECFYCDYTLSFDGDGTYDNLNLRAAIGPQGGRWDLSVYGRNVTDSRPVTQPNTALYGDPATLFRQGVIRGSSYGVELQYNF
jgi:iron complex outermembrane receptor protein